MNPLASRFLRSGLLALCLGLVAAAATLHAAVQPITVKELSLMLRSGYTGDDVLREIAGRPLLVPLDADAEKSLRQAGADTHFLDALKSSHSPLTDAAATAARQRQADIDHRNLEAWEANQAHLMDIHRQAAQTALQAHQQMNQPKLGERLRGLLVTCQPGGLRSYADDALANKQLFAFYFAALTNPQCAQFTPQLVRFYQDYAPQHPAFEVIFVSEDRSAYNMENYMRQSAMPWPALAFDQKAQLPGLAALEKEGVPRLLVLDGAGHPVADSIVDGKNVGPQHVLDVLLHPPIVAASTPTPP